MIRSLKEKILTEWIKKEVEKEGGSNLKTKNFNKCVSVCSIAQSCPTLCGPMDLSQPGSSAHRIFQARILDWGAISFFMGIFPTQGSKIS